MFTVQGLNHPSRLFIKALKDLDHDRKKTKNIRNIFIDDDVKITKVIKPWPRSQLVIKQLWDYGNFGMQSEP